MVPIQPIQDEGYLFKASPIGVLKTSSKMQYGWPEDRDHYYSEGRRRELPDESYEEFFVGPEQQFNQQMNAAPIVAPGKPAK